MWRCLKALPRRLGDLARQFARTGRQLLPTAADLRGLAACLPPRRGSLSRLNDYRQSLAPERRRLLFNLAVALIITLILYGFNLSPQFTGADAWFDWLIELQLGREPERPAVPLGWIDIDDDTHRRWKEPLFVPREKLAELIGFVLFDGDQVRKKDRASLLVVDIEMATRDRSEEEDEAVVQVLERYAEACDQEASCPRVLLAASLRLDQAGLPHQRPSHLDDLVTLYPHLFFWASPLFDRDADGVIRRWRLWEPVCAEGTPVALPSLQLLGAVILAPGEDQVERLFQHLQALLPKSCASGRERIVGCRDPGPTRSGLYLGGGRADESNGDDPLPLSLACDQVSRRILYATTRASGGTTKTVNPRVWTVSGADRSLVARLPASTVLESLHCGESRGRGFGDLRNRAVFIGASYYDSRDLHRTPVGPMPGVLILMNSLHSLRQYGEVHRPWLMGKIALVVALVFLMSVFFTVWNSFAAKVMASLVIYALLVPLTFLLFGSGLWLDFALPLLAVQFTNTFSDLRELLCGEEGSAGDGPGAEAQGTDPDLG
jgi:hypothetical protein